MRATGRPAPIQSMAERGRTKFESVQPVVWCSVGARLGGLCRFRTVFATRGAHAHLRNWRLAGCPHSQRLARCQQSSLAASRKLKRWLVKSNAMLVSSAAKQMLELVVFDNVKRSYEPDMWNETASMVTH
jgi:hypothetical protein